MTDDVQSLVRKIHQAPGLVVLAVTGGGSGAVNALLEAPGASRTVLEAVVPYAAAALDDFLGAEPEHYCHERTASAMAMAAWQRAQILTADEPRSGEPLIGVACTASLRSDRPKLGPHRAHVAWQTEGSSARASVEFEKMARERSGEEQVVSRLILDELAAACGLSERLPLDLRSGEQVRKERADAPAEWRELVAGERAHAGPDPERNAEGRAAVFPGAFAPWHAGHAGMRQVAARRLGCAVRPEISIQNVDKPPLDFLEIRRRVGQFAPENACVLTRAPTFVQKSEIFPRTTFLVGADTVRRIGDAKYYGGSTSARDAAIAELAAHGARFLVFGRQTGDRFRTLDDVELPAALRALCNGVSSDEFREDVSSTELRGKGEWE